MTLKDNIKTKVDKLNTQELRIIDRLIDTLSKKRKANKHKKPKEELPYKNVIKLLNNKGLTTNDIYYQREDRI